MFQYNDTYDNNTYNDTLFTNFLSKFTIFPSQEA